MDGMDSGGIGAGELVDTIKDVLGRVLHVGDRLIPTTGEPATFTVVDMKPFLHPKAPPGSVVVTLQSTVQFPAHRALQGFVRVQSVAEVEAGMKTDQTPSGGEGPPEKSTIRLV